MATYPGGIKTFTTKTDGVDDVLASHVNDLQDEVTAIETELGARPSSATGTVNTQIQSVVNPTRVRLWRSVNQLTSSGSSFQAIDFNDEVFDTDDMWTAPTGSVINIKSTGWYFMQGQVKFDANANGDRSLAFRTNAGVILGFNVAAPASINTTGLLTTAIEYLVSGTYVEMVIRQNGGSLNVQTSAGHSPYFTCYKMPW